MGSLAEEDAPKLSRTELRKQKLAEYLAAKGRLKPPNPKPYLKDGGTDVKKPSGGLQRPQSSIKEKENSIPSAKDVRKAVKLGSALSEKNANTTTFKRELRTLPRAPSTSLQRLVIKPTLSQTAPQHCRTNSKFTTTGRNVSIKEQKTKTALQTDAGPSKLYKSLKTDQQSMSGQAKTSFRVSSFRSQSISVKTGIPKRTVVTGKESISNQITSASERKFSATRQPRNKVSVKPEVQVVTQCTQTGPAGKARSDTTQITKPLHRNSQPEKARTELTQRKESHSQSNKPGNNKPGLPNTQRKAPTAAETKPALQSAVPKTANPSIRKSTTINKTVKLPPSKTTVPAAPLPKSLPQRSRSFSQTRATIPPKTPKSKFNPGTQGVRTVPLDGKKKINAAQEERIRKLQEWRESRGITYKRPPMPVKPVRRKTTATVSSIYWPTIEKEDEVHRFVCTVDQSLNDCIKLVEQGCPFEQIRDVLSRVPMAQKFAKYWICKVRLMEREGNLNVLPTFEEAVRVVREPVDELRAVIFEILKKKEAKGSAVSPCMEEREEVDSEEEGKPQYDMQTPKPVGALIRGEKGNSSVIKYKITTTPGGKRSQQRERSGRVNGHELRFFTPVRRSLRIERSAPRYPAALQEHDPCVTSLPDLLTEDDGEVNELRAAESEDSPLYVYRENEALKDHVAIELVYE
ncbi:cytoskeleton-associated protein 2-like [Astyanax mexicanus]|uniref:Cytoskeleton-associated protein 2-like n=1 Tax=Astyanax mexicanus TaxID=7994 RepID=A0A8T2KRJ0_ASTMX|nr:cytoskeleton-associated protein 2-like [Astyanax mexicanus]